jgi:hypothetical protein
MIESSEAFLFANTPLQNKDTHIFVCGFRLTSFEIIAKSQSFTMQHDATAVPGNANTDIWELIQALVLGHVPADRILELFYLAQQPGVLEMVREAFDMRPESRAAMSAFFAVADAKSINAEVDRAGRLILSAPGISEASAILREVERTAASPEAVNRGKQAQKFS